MNNEHDPLDNDTSYDTGETNDTFLEHQETIYYAVYDNPHTGVASLGPLREGELNRFPRRDVRLNQTQHAAARASRKRLRDHAVYRKLGACLVLTYAALPSNPKKDVQSFIKSARPYYLSRMHYAVVTEGSCNEGGIRIHHNVLLPASPNLYEIARNWNHGDVFIGINPTDESIRRMVNYVTKEFVRTSGLNARFMKSKSKTPRPVRSVFDNRADAEDALMNMISEDATGVSIYKPGCADRVIVYRDVNPPQI